MWVALLNLENMYGSQESLTKVFERAVQYNEPLKVFLQLADIYTKSEKFQVGVWAKLPIATRFPVTQKLTLGKNRGSREISGKNPHVLYPVRVPGPPHRHRVSRETACHVKPPHLCEPAHQYLELGLHGDWSL